jgi:hypothetical protein
MAANDTQTQIDAEEAEDPTQAETAATEAEVEAAPDKSTDELKAEADKLRKQLKETNRKAAADRLRLEEIDREKQEREDAKLSETAKQKKRADAETDARRQLEAEVAKLKADLLNREMDQHIRKAAQGIFNDPELAPKLVDRDQIEYDPETGKFSRVKEAVERVLRDHPGLATAQRGGGSPAAMRTRRPGQGTEAEQQLPNYIDHFIRSGNYEPM